MKSHPQIQEKCVKVGPKVRLHRLGCRPSLLVVAILFPLFLFPPTSAAQTPVKRAKTSPTPALEGATDKQRKIAPRRGSPQRRNRSKDAIKKGGVVLPPTLLDEVKALEVDGGASDVKKKSKLTATERALQRREELKERQRKHKEARKAAGGDVRKPASRDGRVKVAKSARKGGSPAEDSAINILPTFSSVKPEEGKYQFSIVDGTYEDLISMVARETGLGVFGVKPPDGKVNFVTEEELSFDEMLKRIRMLLFNYKPLEPYWLLRRETHLEVIRVNDYLRELEPGMMYRSEAEFQAANLADEELVLVLYTPKSGSLSNLTIVRDFMPDYVRVTPLENSNTVAIFALASDIRKYLDLVPILVSPQGQDPRTLEVIKVIHITPSEAYEKLKELMDLDEASVRPRPRPRGGSKGALESVQEPALSVVPSDGQGVLIVRGMRNKIEEIKLLLPYVDVDTDTEFRPVVIDVKYADPDALVLTLQDILTPADSASNVKRPKSRGRKPAGGQTATIDKIRLITHPVARAIIVMASDQDVVRVRQLILSFDIETEVGPIRLTLEHAEAEDIVGTISKLIGGSTKKTTKKARSPGEMQSEVVAAPDGDAIYFTGSPDDLEQVKLLLVQLDVPGEKVELHIVQLKNQLPSFVAGILQEYQSGQAGGSAKRPTRPKRPVGKGGTKGKFTSDDDGSRLYVLCTDKEWDEFKKVIDELELLTQPAEFVVLPVEHISPELAIEKVSALIAGGGSKKGPASKSGIRYETTDHGMVVIGAKDSEISLIKQLLAQFDKPENMVRRVFVIKHREAADMMETINSLLTDSTKKPSRGKPRPGKPKSSGSEDGQLKIVQLDDRLIVRTSPEQMEEVAALILEFDVARDTREIRVYDDFPPGTDIVALSDSLQALMSSKEGGSSARPKSVKKPATAPEGAQFLPQPSSGKLIVVAEAERFEEIEELLAIIRPTEDVAEVLVEYVLVTHVDPDQIVDMIEPLLAIKVQHLILTGVVEEGSGRSDIGMRVGGKKKSPKSTGGSGDLYQLIPDTRNHRIVVAAAEVIVAEARKLIQSFDTPADGDLIQTAFIEIEHASAAELVDLIEPLLTLKVQQLVSEGKLAGDVAPSSSKSTKKPGLRIAGRPSKTNVERFHLVVDERNRRLVIAAPESIIEEARVLIQQFDLPVASGDEIEVVTITVQHVEPGEMVEQIAPLLDMKVQQLVVAGLLSGEASSVTVPKSKRPGKVNVARKKASTKSERYHMQADDRNGQIVIAAPRVIVDEARGLVELFDKAGDESSAFETITLQNADASEMVGSIQALMGGGSRKRPGGVKPKKGVSRPTLSGDFQIVEAPGGAAVVLQGPVKLVAQAKEWISHLDSIAGGARSLKIFQIQHIDMKMLVDIIVNTVSVPARRAGVRRPGGNTRSKAGGARQMLAAMEDDEEDVFVTTITRTTDDLYLRADLIDHTMIVSASPAKLTEVDRIISNFDTKDSQELINPAPVPKFTYMLQHVDAYDASYELDAVLSVLWEPSDELPHVDYASFGDMLVVRYPHRDRFDEIKELIRKYVDKPSKLARSRPKAFAVPAGISPKDVALWMKINHPELDIVVEDMSPREDQTHGVQELGPRTSAVNRCVMPLAFSNAVKALVLPVVGQANESQPDKKAAAKGGGSAEKSPPANKPKPTGDRDALSDLVREKGRDLLGSAPGRDDETVTIERMPNKSKTAATAASAEKVIIKYDESTGGMIVIGNRSVLEAVPDWLDELEEEMKDLPRPPDIRIYRVKYIDVYRATDIINEMFNATRQQRQQVSRAQQQQQQRARQQQQQQQKQQGNKRQPQQQKTQTAAVPQLPPTSVRVMPNPRDRSLILRADTNQYPAILKLLATIDQPRPINSEMRVYPLEKLNASEVEMLLKDWLGMSASSASTKSPRPASGGARRAGGASTTARSSSGNGGQFPRPIMQRTMTGDMLGIDPKDIKLTSSPRNNSIMALGPVAALDFIGELISDLESNELAERTWVQYELVHAAVPSLISYLRGRYAEGEDEDSGGRRKGDSELASLSSGNLNTPTVIGYTPLRILSVQGTAEQHAEIAELVAKFDRPAQSDFEVINLAHADAAMVAQTLTSIFQGVNLTQGASKKRGKKEAQVSSVSQARFIGQEGGRIVFFSATEHLHKRIHETVKRLEEEAQERATLRTITLEHARPSDVSQAITAAYAPSGREKGTALPAFTVTGDNNSKQLLVMTDDEMFLEIQSLAKLLDRPREFAAEFRVFRLKHANARSVYETLGKLMEGYVKGLPPGEQIDAFGAEVDDQANAIVVLGGPLIFGFVEHALQRIDTPENAEELPGFFMIALKNANASEVASNITRLWSGAVGSAGEEPPVVEANASLNVLIVRGTQAQVDQIKKDFVDPLEGNIAPQLLTETMALKHIRAEEAAELITTIYDKRLEAMKQISGGKLVSPHEFTVVVTPDSSTNAIIVQASEANVTDIKSRIAKMDQADVAAQYAVTTKVYGLTFASPGAVVTIIRERSRMKEQRGGNNKVSLQDMVLAVEEPATQSVAVTANAHNHKWVQTLIHQLDDKETALSRIDQVKSFKLTYADPFIVTEAVTQLFRGGKGSQSSVIAVAEPVARVVIVTASQANLARVELLIADLDTEGSSQQAVNVLHLSNADAESVVKTIDDIFIKSQPTRKGAQAPPISVSALGGSKAVLIKSSAEDFADIEAVVKQLDTEEAGTGEVVRVLTLLYADATEVQQAMQEYLKKSGNNSSDELVGDTRISVLTQSNGLVVSGGASRVDQIEQLVKQLDEESEKGVVPQIIKLEYADVGFILPQLQEMFVDQKGGGKRDRVQPVIVANDLMNSLIIRAAPADIAAIEAIVSKLDTEEAASVTPFKIIKVASGINVEELAVLLETSVNEGIRAASPKGKGRSEVSSVSIQADKRTSTLIVAGNQSYFDDIEEMVHAYERLGPTGETIKIIQLGATPASEVIALIDQLKGGSTSSKSGRNSRGNTKRRTSGSNRSGSSSSSSRNRSGRGR